ncbi:MAG: aminotransferase class IV [Desulfococcaceae bacterium]
MLVYFNGEFRFKNEIQISPDDRGFLFADGVYEVILAHDNRLFRRAAHLERLRNSLDGLRIDLPEAEFRKLDAASETLLAQNNLTEGAATVYIQVTRGAAPRKHRFPEKPTPPTVYASAGRFFPNESGWKNGVAVVTAPDIRWTRCDLKTVSLTANVLASQRAAEKGAQEAVFVRDGMITEGAHTSFAAVFEGVLWTYPECPYILSGITRRAVLELCERLEIPVREHPISRDGMGSASEAMLLGTTTEVTPVVALDGETVGEGTPGPLTRRLQTALRKEIRGE